MPILVTNQPTKCAKLICGFRIATLGTISECTGVKTGSMNDAASGYFSMIYVLNYGAAEKQSEGVSGDKDLPPPCKLINEHGFKRSRNTRIACIDNWYTRYTSVELVICLMEVCGTDVVRTVEPI
jgi:hypothetical protein